MKPGDPVNVNEFIKTLTFDEVYNLRYLIRSWHHLGKKGVQPSLPDPDSDSLTPEEQAALKGYLERQPMGVIDRALDKAIAGETLPVTADRPIFLPLERRQFPMVAPQSQPAFDKEEVERKANQYWRHHIGPWAAANTDGTEPKLQDHEESTPAERIILIELTQRAMQSHLDEMNRKMLDKYVDM